MIPRPADALRTLMMTLMTEVAPELPAGYRQSSTNIIAVTQLLLAHEFDRAAEVRVWENREMRRLFRLAADLALAPELMARLQSAASENDREFTISVLDRANAVLKRSLIELHEAVESLDGAAADTLEAAIWRFLVAAAERRALPL